MTSELRPQTHDSIIIRNGTRLEPNGQWAPSKTIVVQNGKIISLDEQNSSAVDSSHEIDASDCLILPGLIDLNVSLREPGRTRSGTIASETLAAASSGVTALCSCPDSLPINDSTAVTQLILEQAESNGACKVIPLGALTKQLEGEQLTAYAGLKQAGCLGLSNAFKPLTNLLVTQRCFEYAHTHKMPVFINPIEPSLYQGVMHEGEISTSIGLQGIPRTAETIAVAQLIELARASHVHLHLTQLSCAGSVELVRQAKASGLNNISCGVSVAHLLFTDHQVGYFDSLYHVMPPLRGNSDREALIQGLKDGTIDTITSAHQPWEAAEKKRPFAEAESGISTIELLMPIALSLQETEKLPLETFVRAMSNMPAALLNIESNDIAENNTANLFVLNTNIDKIVQTESRFSKGTNIPLVGETMKGEVKATVCEGRISFRSDA